MKNSGADRNSISQWKPESLMELLIAQCTDLEGLLALARRENDAAKREDFGDLLAVVVERAQVGDRLESYHRQVSELRDQLGNSNASYVDPAFARHSVELAVEIQTHDAETTSLLRVAQSRTSETISHLEDSQRNSLAYLNAGRAIGLNCDRRG